MRGLSVKVLHVKISTLLFIVTTKKLLTVRVKPDFVDLTTPIPFRAQHSQNTSRFEAGTLVRITFRNKSRQTSQLQGTVHTVVGPGNDANVAGRICLRQGQGEQVEKILGCFDPADLQVVLLPAGNATGIGTGVSSHRERQNIGTKKGNAAENSSVAIIAEAKENRENLLDLQPGSLYGRAAPAASSPRLNLSLNVGTVAPAFPELESDQIEAHANISSIEDKHEQVEYEFLAKEAPAVNKIVLTSMTSFFCCCSFCGVDRCYMGQKSLGLLKGLTCGGLVIWFVIDWCVIVYNCVCSAPNIDSYGFVATWQPSTIRPAFWLTLVGLCMNCCLCALCPGWGPGSDTAKHKTKDGLRIFRNRDVLKQFLSSYTKPSTRELKRYFDRIDKDKNGKISKHELQEMLKNLNIELNDDEWSKAMTSADKDGDGQMDFDEFCEWFAS